MSSTPPFVPPPLVEKQGVQGAVVEALFRAYFTEGRDISHRQTLLDVVAGAGLDRHGAEAVLNSDGLEAIKEAEALARRFGVDGVPFFIVNDLLKSMVLLDKDGGQVRAVSYDSSAPLERTLKSFAVDLTGNPSYAQLLQQARRRLLEFAHDRLTRHARSLLHGRYARLEPFAQTDDVVQQVYLKILRNQERFWVNARGEPVRTLAEFFGHASAWMRDVLCDLLRKEYGRDDNRPAALPLGGLSSDTGPQYDPSSSTLDGEKLRRWAEFHEAAARLPDDLRAAFDLLWYQGMSQA
jgi:DNA-directed RNA polymerase specialized sigma24 family protein